MAFTPLEKQPFGTPPPEKTEGGDIGVTPKLPEKPSPSTLGWMQKLNQIISDPRLGLDIVKGIGKKVVRTGVSGAEALEKITGMKAVGIDEGFKEEIKPKTVGEKIGYTGAEIVEYVAPIPGAGKAKALLKAGETVGRLGRLARGATRVALEAGEQFGRTAASSGDIARAKTEAAIAGALPVVGKAVKAFSPIKLGELFTGVPTKSWEKWTKITSEAPERAQELRRYVTEFPEQPHLGLVQKTVNRLKEMKTQAQDAYKTATEAWRTRAGDQTFDFTKRLDELNEPLGEFGLKTNRIRDPRTGQITGELTLAPKGQVMPFAKEERTVIQGLLDEVQNTKNLSPDDVPLLLDKFDEAYDAIPLNPDGTAKKSHALIMRLKRKFDDQIQEVLPPDLKEARKMYRDYYEVYDDVGFNVMNKSGEAKKGAESYLANLKNLNKGAERERVTRASGKLGFDVVNEAEDIAIARQIVQDIPQTTKNRTMDIVRGIVGGKAFVGGAGAGFLATGNIPAAIGFVLLNVLSSPKNYSSIIEAIAGAGKKLPIGEALKKIPQDQIDAIRRLFIHGTVPPEE